jgi:nitronate monooxygenase
MKSNPSAWPNTIITELLKMRLPLIQAPMAGGATTPELVAAVSNAGGLGSLGAGYMTADEIKTTIKKIKSLTNKPFAVNLFIPEEYYANEEQIEQARKTVQASCSELKLHIESIKPPYTPLFEEQMNVIVEEKVPIFSFTFGIPSRDWIETFKKNAISLIGTATTLAEAKLLEENNIDAIVAQGSEAGGHRGTFLSNADNALINISSLLPLLIEHIKIPIIAAGGIMTAKGIIELLKLGVSAVQMGTAFLSCTESGIHPLYKKLLLNSSYDNTTLTRAFSGKWARGIMNKFITRMQSHENNILDYPMQNALTRTMRQEATKQNNSEFMSMWAGQAAYLCKALPAAQLIEELDAEIIVLLKQLS